MPCFPLVLVAALLMPKRPVHLLADVERAVRRWRRAMVLRPVSFRYSCLLPTGETSHISAIGWGYQSLRSRHMSITSTRRWGCPLVRNCSISFWKRRTCGVCRNESASALPMACLRCDFLVTEALHGCVVGGSYRVFCTDPLLGAYVGEINRRRMLRKKMVEGKCPDVLDRIIT